MKSPLAFVLSVSKPFIPQILGLIMVALGWSFVVNVQPLLVQRLIDTASFYKGPDLFHELVPYVMAYICVGTGFVGLFRYYDFLILSLVPRQKEYIALKLMRRMMGHSATFYQRHFAGNLTNKVNDVTMHTPELIKIATDNFVTCFCTLAFVLYNVSRIGPQFAWALILWLGIFVGGSLYLFSRNNQLASASAEARSQVIGHIVDMLINVVNIRLFVRARYEERLLNQTTSHSVQKEQNRDRFFMRLHFFQGASFWIFEALCFWWLLKGISAKTITPGGFVLIFTLNLQVLDQFWNLGSEIRDFWEKIGHIRQALKVIYVNQDLPCAPDAKPLVVTRGQIEFDRVSFAYEGGRPLFENKSIRIEGKQKIGLVGYSGSGKSTFISLVLRLFDVNAGRILIDGQDIRSVTLDSLYESISIIPQDCPLFNRTLMENIRYGRLDATDEEVYEAAKKAQIHDVILASSQGYQTLAGEKGMRFSGGQRQRIAIARAVLKNAPILVLDEATSQLDALTEEKLTVSLGELMEGKTVFVIAHRLSTMTTMDRLLVFEAGKIVQDGSHQQLIEEEGLYRQLWDAQSEKFLSHPPLRKN